MKPIGQLSAEEPRNFASDVFERPPLRSHLFIAGTVMMGFNLAGTGHILFRYWGRLPMSAVLYMGLSVASMLALWTRAFTIWRRLHEIYSHAKSDPSFAWSQFDIALRNAAALMGACLYFSFFIAGWLLLALAWTLKSA